MRIEMTGPPTAGKSSIVKSLRKRGMEKMSVVSVARKIPKKWGAFGKGVEEIYSQRSFKSLPLKTLNALAAAWDAKKSKDWIVFDEALILCGFSLAIRIPEEAEWYFKHVPLPDILVYVTASKDVLFARNELRGDRSRPDKTLRCMRAHKKYIRFLKARQCNILRFDTSDMTTEFITNEIVKEIKDVERRKNRKGKHPGRKH
jgi:thymidylate kinase